MNNERIKIIPFGTFNSQTLAGTEGSTVQIARTACFVCTKGSGRILLNGMEYTVEANSLTVYFSYSALRIIEKKPDTDGVIISCNLETIQPLLYRVSDFNGLFHIRQNPYTRLTESQVKMLLTYLSLMSGIITRMETEERSLSAAEDRQTRGMVRQQVDLLGNSLMLGIVSCYTGHHRKTVGHSRKDDVLQKFITQLYHAYKKEHDVKYYAEAQCLTCRYFSAIIKEKTGRAPSEWITAALLGEAKRMLTQTSRTVKDIAADLNFPNQSYFGKWFKNLVGCSPLEYKKGKKGKTPSTPEYASLMGLNLMQ